MHDTVEVFRCYHLLVVEAMVEVRKEVEIRVCLDRTFVEPLELENMYWHNQDNEHQDEVEHWDYFSKHGSNDTSLR